MKIISKLITFILILLLFQNSYSDFILPFTTINIGINQSLLEEDFLSNLLSQYLSCKFIIGSNNEEINAIINMSQIGFYIYEDAYNFKSSMSIQISNKSKSFYKKDSEIGYDANDTLCLVEYTPFKFINDIDIKKCTNYNSVNFELLKSIQSTKENYFKKYSIIGLGESNNQDEYIVFTFFNSLVKANVINSYDFSFNFLNNTNSGKVEGYIYIGKDKYKEDKGMMNMVVSSPISGQLFWNLKFRNIYTAAYNTTNSSIYWNYKIFDIKTVELIGDLPYIIGIKPYKLYLDSYFFSELLHSGVCYLTKIKLDEDYSTYVCDNTSKLFREKLDKEFPLLKFEHSELNKTFVLDQYDLFSFNYLNKSDTNIYFLVLFSEKKGNYHPYNPSQNEIMRWKLGIPFFKKYKLIFNAEFKTICYYENFYPNPKDDSESTDNTDSSNTTDNPDITDTIDTTEKINTTDTSDVTNITDTNNTEINQENENDNNEKNKKLVEDGNNNLNLYLAIGGGVIIILIIIAVSILFCKNIINCHKKKKDFEFDDEFDSGLGPNESNSKIDSLNG